MSGLKYDVHKEEDAVRLALEGELDMALAPELRQLLHQQLEAPPKNVIVDLDKVSFVDSSILATLIEAYKLLQSKSSRLRIVNSQPAVRDAFQLARVAGILGVE